jgi:hypothetical protein
MRKRVKKRLNKTWRFKGYILPLRMTRVPKQGVFEVPQHIVRIDINEPGKAGTHGWQVRYEGTLLFSDVKYKGNPEKSLRAAKNYLRDIYTGSASANRKLHTREIKSRKAVLLGQRGVSLCWKSGRRNPEDRELYCQVSIAIPGVSKSRNMGIYIGNKNTVSEERLKSALKKGIAIRRYAEDRYHEGDEDALRALSLASLPTRVLKSAARIKTPQITVEDTYSLDTVSN